MKILYLIPARGRSKGLPGKNIKILGNKPLINYSIDFARNFTIDSNICVSSDDKEIIKCVNDYGLKTYFKRPENLATDYSTTNEVINHALSYYESIGVKYDLVILLQPTSPFRKIQDLKNMLNIWSNDLDLLVSVRENHDSPYFNIFEENSKGFLQKSKESTVTRRQDAPKAYAINGSIYIYNVKSIKKNEIILIKKYVMKDHINSLDIDTSFDFMICQTVIKNNLLDWLIKKSNTLNQKIIQPLILNHDGSKIWNAGGLINNFFGTFETLKRGKSFKNFKSERNLTEWFTGCCVLIKSEIFNDIGFFDERFFAYYEDVDYSIRLKKMGYSIALMTNSYLQHYESASSKSMNKIEGNLSPYVHYLNIRNHILLLKKHSKSFNLIGVLLYQLVKIFSYLIYFLIRFRFNKFKMVSKGLVDAINFKK